MTRFAICFSVLAVLALPTPARPAVVTTGDIDPATDPAPVFIPHPDTVPLWDAMAVRAVVAAADLMRRENVDFNILCTVHAANADRPLEVYRYFRDDLGVDFIQFIPIVERATTTTLEVANEGWSSGR